MSDKKLTPKQRKFVKEYIETGNATTASINAKYSEKSARQIGSENLSKPYIKEAIEKVMSKEAEELGITTRYVLQRLKGFADSENEKIASQILKSIELLGRHLKMFHENDLNVKLSEEEKHKKNHEILEGLA